MHSGTGLVSAFRGLRQSSVNSDNTYNATTGHLSDYEDELKSDYKRAL